MANVILEHANDITLGRSSNTRRAISNSGYARIEKAGPTFYSLEVNLALLQTNDYLNVNRELINLEDGVNFLNSELPSKYFITTLRGTYDPIDIDYSTNTTSAQTNVNTITLPKGGLTLTDIPTSGKISINGNNVLYSARTQTATTFTFTLSTFESWTNNAPVFINKTNVTQITADPINNSVVINNVKNGTTLLAGDFIQFSNSTKVYQVKSNATAASNSITVTLNTGIVIDPTDTANILVGDNVKFNFMLSESPTVTIIPQNQNNNLYSYSTINLQEVL